MNAVSPPDASTSHPANPLKAVLWWIMQRGGSHPVLSDSETAAQLERDYRWNFTVNLLDGGFFWFGCSFFSAATILPLFLSKLTDNPLPFGILAVIAASGWSLPQLLTANAAERLPRMKPVVVNLGLFAERLPVAMLIVAALVATRSSLLAMVVMLLAFAWHAYGAGAVAVSWQNLIGRCFPVDRRGRLLGLQVFIGAGAGALGAGFSTWLLKTYAFPTNFVYAFGIAAVTVLISWGFLALTREPAQEMKGPRQSNREYLAQLPDLVRCDRNFRSFLVARCLMALGGMGTGFVTLSAVERWHVPDATVGIFTVALLLGQTVGNLAIGFLADRFGHKLGLQVAILSSGVAFALAWLAPSPILYYGVFVLMGIGYGAVAVSGILMVLEFAPPEMRPRYIGVANTSAGVVGMVAPLLGAALAEANYGLLFALAALAYLSAWATMRWKVVDPRFVSSE